jgi:UDP-N-acetylglucosamine diphosphorylase/glucosamine-1-phosphate N-acetyltransferase
MRFCVFEDAGVANLEPLALTRPAFDLWFGAGTLLNRLQRHFAAREAAALVRPYLADLCRQDHPDLVVNDSTWLKCDHLVLANARWSPPAELFVWPETDVVGLVGGQVAYVVLRRLNEPEAIAEQLTWQLEEWKRTLPCQPADGLMIDYPWHLVDANGKALAQDFMFWRGEGTWRRTDDLAIVGPAELLLVAPDARLEPFVTFDTTRGPILLDQGAVVQSFSRLEGPCYLGTSTQIFGGKIRGGSIGPECRVGGEFETSVMQGYSNKYHDGFLGHSYIGAWVNFGAGTQVSDLRNDYGPVTLTIAGRKVPTGQVKAGSFIGDHTRTSISTLLNTGTVVGPFSQLLTSGSLLPRLLPAFCKYGHGRVQERTDLSQMLATAAKVLERRGRQWTAVDAELFFHLYEQTSAERRQLIRESEQSRMRQVV